MEKVTKKAVVKTAVNKIAQALGLLVSLSLSSLSALSEEVNLEKSSTDASPPKRKSQIKFSVLAGKDRYRDSEVSAQLGLDPMWALTGSGSGEKSDGIKTASAFSLGVSAQFSPDFDSNISFRSRREPDSVVARGLSTGFNWNLASLWKGEQATELELQATWMKYKQDEGSRTKVRDGGISQNSVLLSLNQELNSDVAIQGSYSLYGLGGADAAVLSQAIASRPQVNEGFLTVVDGFPKDAYGLGADFQVREEWSIGLNLFKTNYFNGNTSHGISVSTNLDLNKEWSAGMGISTTRNTSDDSTNSLLDLSVAYNW